MPMDKDRYVIEFLSSAARQLEKLPRAVIRPVAEAIDQLSREPRPEGSRLLAGTGGERIWRIAVGNYRVPYQIEDRRLVVLVIGVADRRDAYKQAALRRLSKHTGTER